MTATTTTPSADLITAYLDHLRELSRAARTIDDRRNILTRVDADLPLGLDRACGDELAAWIYREEWGPQTPGHLPRRAAVLLPVRRGPVLGSPAT